MNCSSCSYTVAVSDAFCSRCGNELSAPQTPSSSEYRARRSGASPAKAITTLLIVSSFLGFLVAATTPSGFSLFEALENTLFWATLLGVPGVLVGLLGRFLVRNPPSIWSAVHKIALWFSPIAALVAMGSCYNWIRPPDDSKPRASMLAPPPPPPPVRAFAYSEPANGRSQVDMDATFLPAWQSYVGRVQTQQVREYLRSVNDPAADRAELSAQSTYRESGGLRLAVVRTQGVRTSSVVVGAYIGDQFRTVACTRTATLPIPVSSGACADKIRETLGVDIAE